MARSIDSPGFHRFRALVVLALAGGLLAGGCGATRLRRSLHSVADVQTLDRRSAYLKVHAKDGQLYVLSEWSVDEAARQISGLGERLSLARERLEAGRLTVSLDDVALIETNVVQRSPAIAALAVVTGISVAVTAFCIADPKACFGSCPTFYVDGAAGAPIHAEGFSSSISPSLEARDVDALYRARPGTDGAVTVTMKNEALETHVVRHVRLLAAARPSGGRVLATLEGEFREATDVRALEACDAEEGDCRSLVQAFDGIERFGVADGAESRTAGGCRTAASGRRGPPRARDRLATDAREHVPVLPVSRVSRPIRGRHHRGAGERGPHDRRSPGATSTGGRRHRGRNGNSRWRVDHRW